MLDSPPSPVPRNRNEGNNMNPRHAILALVLLAGPEFAQQSVMFAQQSVTRPVLTVSPPPQASTQPATPVSDSGKPTTPPLGTGLPAQPASGLPQTGGPGTVPETTAPAPAAGVSSTYIIRPQDSLEINVWKEPGLSGTLPVRPDGMISLSLLGDLPASGLTPMQLGADITTRLKKFINDPSVTVTVLGIHAQQIYLLGEISHIGPIPYTPEMTPLQAISVGGGLSPFANSKKIYILRGEQGKQKKIPFDYKKAIKDGNQQGISLMPGDTIVVP